MFDTPNCRAMAAGVVPDFLISALMSSGCMAKMGNKSRLRITLIAILAPLGQIAQPLFGIEMGRTLGKPLGPVLDRLREALNAQDLGEMAERLGAPYGTVRNWHQRDSVPMSWLSIASLRTNRPVDWFLHGDQGGAKKFAPSGLVINQNGARDAFEPHQVREPEAVYRISPVPETSSPKSAAPPLLLHVITAVLRQLREQDIELPPEKVTELISVIYDDIAMSDSQDVFNEKQVSSRTQRLIRLAS